jgi:hypothetical protein
MERDEDAPVVEELPVSSMDSDSEETDTDIILSDQSETIDIPTIVDRVVKHVSSFDDTCLQAAAASAAIAKRLTPESVNWSVVMKGRSLPVWALRYASEFGDLSSSQSSIHHVCPESTALVLLRIADKMLSDSTLEVNTSQWWCPVLKDDQRWRFYLALIEHYRFVRSGWLLPIPWIGERFFGFPGVMPLNRITWGRALTLLQTTPQRWPEIPSVPMSDNFVHDPVVLVGSVFMEIESRSRFFECELGSSSLLTPGEGSFLQVSTHFHKECLYISGYIQISDFSELVPAAILPPAVFHSGHYRGIGLGIKPKKYRPFIRVWESFDRLAVMTAISSIGIAIASLAISVMTLRG